jgi:hypothetical protein
MDKTHAFKIGIDIHGVIDVNPKVWERLLSQMSWCIEIYILTGPPASKAAKELEQFGIRRGTHYDTLLSVCDFLESRGVNKLPNSTPDNPWYPEDEWNKAKGLMCGVFGISMLIDDSQGYFAHMPEGTVSLSPYIFKQ